MAKAKKRKVLREKRGRGQPTKLTPFRLTRVLNARRCGMGVSASCNAAGIDAGTHANWMEQGRLDAGNGQDTLYAEYFRRVPVAADEGVYRRRAEAQRILANPEASAVDVQRAKATMAYEAMVEGGKMGQARRAALKRGLREDGTPAGPPAPVQEQATVAPAQLSRLSGEEFTRYQVLAARARVAFTRLALAELAEFQALLRKAQGEELTPSTPGAETGGAVPDGSPQPQETSRAPSGDAPPTAP